MLTLALVSAVAVLLIWIGYPLFIAGLAGLRGRSQRQQSDDTRWVSVILATREDAPAVRERVADILRSYRNDRLEVVIGLDPLGGVDASSLANGLPGNVRVVTGDAPGGKASTLNAAVRAATGEILVLTDTAQRFGSGAIARLVGALGDPRVGAVSGALQTGRVPGRSSLAEWYWMYERWLRRLEAQVHSTVGVTGAIYAMPAALWAPLPAGLILDDVYTPMRLVLDHKRVAFCEDAVAVDERRFSPQREYLRKVRTLTGVFQLCAWLPAVLIPVRNPIWLQFVFHKLLRLLTPYLLALFAVGAVITGHAWLARSSAAAMGGVLLAVVGLLVVAAMANRRGRELVATAVAMQFAVLRATISGMRGQWDVWSR